MVLEWSKTTPRSEISAKGDQNRQEKTFNLMCPRAGGYQLETFSSWQSPSISFPPLKILYFMSHLLIAAASILYLLNEPSFCQGWVQKKKL